VGEATTRPDPRGASPEAWRSYLYLRRNPCGWQHESWYHRAGCRKYVTVERHTLTNEVRPATGPAAGVPVEGGTAAERGSAVDATATPPPGGAP